MYYYLGFIILCEIMKKYFFFNFKIFIRNINFVFDKQTMDKYVY